MSLNNLGTLLAADSKFDEALSAFEQSLDTGRKAFGASSPEVAASLLGLGAVHEKLNQIAGAHRLYEEALDLSLRNFGPEAPQKRGGRRFRSSFHRRIVAPMIRTLPYSGAGT